MKIQITKLPKNRYGIGGVLQSHGADWNDNLITINAGGSHEENPYDGVQMGVDQEGTPNLVEEGETVFNDYVYSTRIMADEETKKKFHLPKKKEISYADISKRLGKEIAERPNDPYSQAAYEMQMTELANQQERQKQEMEAQRAQEAFAALSPEEQTAIMQQVGQQQAQEQAMQEQALQQQYSPEEMAVMQQQMMGQEAQEGYAEGGHLFADGGALQWLKENHPELGPQVMAAIANGMNTHVRRQKLKYGKKENFVDAYNSINRMRSMNGSFSAKRVQEGKEHYNDLVNLGINKKVAFGLSFPDVEKIPSVGGAGYDVPAYNEAKKMRDDLYDELVRGNEKNRNSGNAENNEANGQNRQSEKDKNSGKDIDKVVDMPKAAQNRTSAVNAINSGKGMLDTIKEAQQKQYAAVQAAQQAQQMQGLGADAEEPVETVTGNLGNTGNSVNTEATGNNGGWKPYSWYRNGSDGISEPTGFTVGDNGLVTAYTPAYRDLVNRLGADSIRQWAAEHPNDSSLQSFLARGNRLEDLTDEQWRRGATDGKYGFMHHVAEKMLNGENGNNGVDENNGNNGGEAASVVEGTGNPRTFHILEGADKGLPDNPNLWEYEEPDLTTLGAEVRRKTLPDGSVVVYHGEKKESNKNTGNIGNTENYVGEDLGNPKPKYKAEWPRYAGIFGPAVGLGLQLAGVGKPDTSGLDAALQIAQRGDAGIADYQPIGNYITYRPMDIWYNQNRMDANSRATDRAILNSAAPQGTRMAGLLANGYNSQLGSGELYRNALEYNDNLRKQVADFNRGTDMFNAQAYNQTSLANAQMRARNKALNAQMAMDAAAQKMAADAGWNQGIYGNLSGLFKGLSDIGRENAQWNMISDMWADGLAGTATSKTNSARGHLKDDDKKSKGGKINKRRGFTF